MSEPSDWPLSRDAIRILVPRDIEKELENHVLSSALYPRALGYYPKAHHHAMKRLHHDDFLLMYCIEGEGRLTVEGRTYRIEAGDVILLPPAKVHEYAAKTDNPWSLFWFHFRGPDAQAFCEHLHVGEEHTVLRQMNDVHLQALFRDLLTNASLGYSLDTFLHIANQLRNLLSYMGIVGRRRAHLDSFDAVSRVTTYMRQNLHRPLHLDDLAEMSHLSKYYFNRKYKALTGHSPMQHFTHLKVEQSCLLLEGSSLGIADIAFQLGYEDPLYFSRVFRKIVGVSPSVYRSRTK